MINLSKPKLGISAKKFILQALKKNEISKGEFVEQFEKEFAAFVGYRYASTCSNGTMALFLALKAIGVAGGEVILPSLTFAATADAVVMAGAKPVFADISETALCLTSETVKPLINDNTRAIITVGLYGIPAFTSGLRALKLPLIEDAAESLGGFQKDMANFSCYSFFGNKVMTTGEGGMVCTNDPEMKKKLDMLRNHGRAVGYWHMFPGVNARMSNITAALGLSQLRDLPKNLAKRREILKWYGMKPAAIQKIGPWLMIARNKNKEKIVKLLKSKGVEARVGFYPLHIMPAYQQDISLPVSEKLGKEVFLLPCHPDLTQKEVKKICFILLQASAKSGKRSKKS